jgi:N-acetylmuramoyl-L-alanine amidase
MIKRVILLIGLLLILTPQLRAQNGLTTVKIEGIEYISAQELAKFLEATIFFEPYTQKLVLKVNQRLLRLTPLSSVVVADDQPLNMPYEVRWLRGEIWVPARFIVPALCILTEQSLAWDPSRSAFLYPPPSVNISGLEIKPKENGTLITVHLTKPLSYEIKEETINEISLLIPDGKPWKEGLDSTLPQGAIGEITTSLEEGFCCISFRLRRPNIKYRSYYKSNPPRIIISLWERVSHSPPEKEDPLDVVVIDPGHGGKDPGAIGPTGVMEKDVVLKIALRLKELLRKRLKLKVILTREKDEFLPLSRRTQIANENNADLFMSIHANACRKKEVKGFEVFFLDYAKNDEARAIAAAENSAIRFESPLPSPQELSDLDFILLDMIQNEYHKESSEFAEITVKKLSPKLGIKGRGVDQAGFYVLNGAFMPAVLVEVAFISNPEDEKLLKQTWFHKKVAEALYESIKEFKERSKKRG